MQFFDVLSLIIILCYLKWRLAEFWVATNKSSKYFSTWGVCFLRYVSAYHKSRCLSMTTWLLSALISIVLLCCWYFVHFVTAMAHKASTTFCCYTAATLMCFSTAACYLFLYGGKYTDFWVSRIHLLYSTPRNKKVLSNAFSIVLILFLLCNLKLSKPILHYHISIWTNDPSCILCSFT